MEVDINPNEYTRNMEFDKATADLITLINERQKAHDELLKEIKLVMTEVREQVKKTNGRVTRIEEYRELVAEPAIECAEKTKEQVAELHKFRDEVITSAKTTKIIVGSVVSIVIAASFAIYGLWLKDLSSNIAKDVMKQIEETYYFE